MPFYSHELFSKSGITYLRIKTKKNVIGFSYVYHSCCRNLRKDQASFEVQNLIESSPINIIKKNVICYEILINLLCWRYGWINNSLLK